MRPKTIKSNQVACDTPAVECTCGSPCVNMDDGSYLFDVWASIQCEDCGQVWELPSDVELKVVFTKKRGGK